LGHSNENTKLQAMSKFQKLDSGTIILTVVCFNDSNVISYKASSLYHRELYLLNLK